MKSKKNENVNENKNENKNENALNQVMLRFDKEMKALQNAC